MQQTLSKAPLPSWREGQVKSAILDFVRAAVGRIPEGERVAVFDNDGTLWCERPAPFQLLFTADRLNLELSDLAKLDKKTAYERAMKVTAGASPDELKGSARDWVSKAEHGQLKRHYQDCVYQPQLELLEHLRANGFKIFIVTGGGVDFVRGFAEKVYGVPPERVIGSSLKLELRDGGLVKLPEVFSFDDREEKVRNIELHIGRRPILAFGNSDGDLAMLRYTAAIGGLALLLHHDDAAREYAYDRDFKVCPLAEALDRAGDYNITVTSMKKDWSGIFPNGGAS